MYLHSRRASPSSLACSMVLLLALFAFNHPIRARDLVSFSNVEASAHNGDRENLKLTIDGINASPLGWRLRHSKPQSVIFTTTDPLEADLIEFSLHFMSGRSHASFADFTLSFTTDATPALNGNWQSIVPLNFSATTCVLSRGPDNHLLAEESDPVVTGGIPDDIYRISARLPSQPVTGFRIETYPVHRSATSRKNPVMAWSVGGQFTLTEFSLEVLSTSTNIARGAPVFASHPLHQTNSTIYQTTPARFRNMAPSALTDGWPSTIAHPQGNVEIKDFYFEVDLGQERTIDHLNLRQRGDEHNLSLFSRMRIQLYEKKPELNAEPTWEIFNRSDGSYPDTGEVDTLYPQDGRGKLQGRYLRISTESKKRKSPQLAEIEVYETRTPQLVAVTTDNSALRSLAQLQIPPKVQRLGFHLDIPQTGRPFDRLYRWRLAGENKGWQTSNSLLLEIPCPPAGAHLMELQAAHSDGKWDSSLKSIPFTVQARFTETTAFLWFIAGGTLLLGVLFSRRLAQRKIKRFEARSAIETERSRIAANMHDDVGARLAQLAVLHDVFALEHQLAPAAKTDLEFITTSTRDAMTSLDDAVWTVNPRNATLPALATYLMQHADSYLLPLGISCQITSPSKWPEVQLRPGIRQKIVLAFKESLQNIVKHAEASEVKLLLAIDRKQLIIDIIDNGRGFSQTQQNSGQDGLINMRQHLESVRGSCAWSQPKDGGTAVQMKFPYS